MQRDNDCTREAVKEAFRSFLYNEIRRQQGIPLASNEPVPYTLSNYDEYPCRMGDD